MDTTPPPISDNADGLSIHLSYIRRDISEIKNTQSETNRKIEELGSNYVTRADFNTHLEADEDHEQRIRILEKGLWKFIGASSIISSIVALLGSYIVQHILK